jgi:pimeloyl-ACP methyl ester carboxylesterase
MPFCTSYDGVRLFYTDTGAAAAAAAAPHPPRPVLFLTHGFASSHRLWDAQLPRLASAGYRCVRWDMRGHGQSGKPPANDDARHPHRYSKWSQVHDMRAVLAACGLLGGPAVILVAHSMGGMDSLLFTLKCNLSRERQVAGAAAQDKSQTFSPAGLVLYGTGPGFRSDKGRLGWNRTASKIAAKYEAKGLEALAAACRGNYTQREDDPLAVEFEDLGGQLALARNLKKITQPCAIVIGQHDKAFGRASAMMAKELPDARLYHVPNAGHMACEKNAPEFNARLVEALAALQQAAEPRRPRL